MKKLLIILTIIISCLGISRVSAESLTLNLNSDYDTYKSEIGMENLNIIIDDIVDKYKDNYKIYYPYYYISINFSSSSSCGFYNSSFLNVYLGFSSEIPYIDWSGNAQSKTLLSAYSNIITDGYIKYEYPIYKSNLSGAYSCDEYIENSEYVFNLKNFNISESVAGGKLSSVLYLSESLSYYEPSKYYYSNFDLTIPSLDEEFPLNLNLTSRFFDSYDDYLVPKLGEENKYSAVSFNSGTHVLEPYYLYDNYIDDESALGVTYAEINLNDYAYVALALKDYSKYNYSTVIEVKGQYCPTPIYAMGLETSEDIIGTKVSDVCSPYYSEYTPVRVSFYESLVKNFPVYYLKSYDVTRDNYVRVDTDVFDITYISEEDKDNPYVLVQGNIYPTIPFDKLPSNAIQNTEIGYVPEESEEFSFNDIFTAPLDFLLEIWGTITTFFSLITSFIALMPPELRGFLFASFTLGISLGLIKIIIG